jgi:ssDNA-binding Zn-finger/Zn-ribbon topoisomerase 1
MKDKKKGHGLISLDDHCPKCGKSLTVRIGPQGRYIGCTAFPQCDYTHFGQVTSILIDETETMERERRLAEQAGHRKRARVHAREHHERQEVRQQQGLEGELQNNILQHPALNTQRFDGIDPSVNPEPALNTEARREFDNERREQEKEKQLRLGNMPKFSTAPKPQGPA